MEVAQHNLDSLGKHHFISPSKTTPCECVCPCKAVRFRLEVSVDWKTKQVYCFFLFQLIFYNSLSELLTSEVLMPVSLVLVVQTFSNFLSEA